MGREVHKNMSYVFVCARSVCETVARTNAARQARKHAQRAVLKPSPAPGWSWTQTQITRAVSGSAGCKR